MSKTKEWNGYIVRQGDEPKKCSFVMPQDKAKFYKADKKTVKNSEPKSVDLDPIESIRKLLTKITDKFTPSEKMYFIQENLGVSSFKDLNGKNKATLRKLVKRLETFSETK